MRLFFPTGRRCRIRACSWLIAAALALPLLPFSPFSGSAAAKDPTVEERLFAAAEAKTRMGRLEEAVPDLERVLKLNPAHPGARYHMAMFKLAKREFSVAKALLEGVGNDPEYGSKARGKLQELKLQAEQNELTRSVHIYLEAGAFPEALKECRKALARGPSDPDLLFYGAFTAALIGEREYAKTLAMKRATVSGVDPVELQTFLDGWFARDHAPREALERLVSLKDRRFFVPPVRLVIRDLMKQLGLTDDYERFMLSERDKPGADRPVLDRDLARFYVEQGQYQKAISLLESRPVESMEDNLLLIEVLSLAGREPRAMTLARTLLNTGKEEEALRSLWLTAWLHKTRVDGAMPTGVAETGDTYEAIVRENVLWVLKQQKSEIEKGKGLLTALQAAVVLGEADLIDPTMQQALRLNLDDALTSEALETAQEMSLRSMGDRAVRLLEWVLAQRPEHAVCMRLLAENYYQAGRATDSVKLLENALQQDPDSLKSLLLLTDALVLTGRPQEAHKRILEKLNDPKLDPLPRRQLETKAFILAGTIPVGTGQSDASDNAAGSNSGGESVATGASGLDPGTTRGINPGGGDPEFPVDPFASITVPTSAGKGGGSSR
ncbi:MAG: tetratricopeptide repeat protein [Candidatus Ozemobacteraceae bacterium]